MREAKHLGLSNLVNPYRVHCCLGDSLYFTLVIQELLLVKKSPKNVAQGAKS